MFKIRSLFACLNIVTVLVGLCMASQVMVGSAKAQSNEDFQLFLQRIKQQGISRGFKPASLERAFEGVTLDTTVIALTQK